MKAPASDVRDAAMAALHSPTDGARAVWHGQVLVGHRRSIEAGCMFWALPGGEFADGHTLLQTDPHFHILAAPSMADLVDQQPVLKELTS